MRARVNNGTAKLLWTSSVDWGLLVFSAHALKSASKYLRMDEEEERGRRGGVGGD